MWPLSASPYGGTFDRDVPLGFLGILAAMIVTYLALVQIGVKRFVRPTATAAPSRRQTRGRLTETPLGFVLSGDASLAPAHAGMFPALWARWPRRRP
jgi:hypothetical protein